MDQLLGSTPNSNLAAIETLEKMHHENAKERGVISKHIENNPWLIDPTWMLSKAEGRVATWIKKKFGLEKKRKSGDDDRADFFCVAVGGTLHIVEIKRGAHVAKSEDVLQAEKYRDYVVKRFGEITDPKAIKYSLVQSHLIAAELHKEAENVKKAYADQGWVFFTTWDDLIERAKQSHHQFREILQKKAGETEADLREVGETHTDKKKPMSEKVRKSSTSGKRKKRVRKKK